MASPRSWPFDDDDRSSGSVRPLSQADLEALLAHLGDDPDELLAATGADRPVVAVRVLASVGQPGGSAQATWRRARAAEWATWTRTLPWRLALTLGIAAGGGVLSSLLAPRLSLVVGAVVGMAAGWGLRFKPSPDAVAWRRGGRGSGELLGCFLRWSGRGGRSCTTWLSQGAASTSAPGSLGARWSATACQSWRPRICPACFAPFRRCWGPNGSPPWPARPESTSALPLDSQQTSRPPLRRRLLSRLYLAGWRNADWVGSAAPSAHCCPETRIPGC
jgi:hypothetical protein